MEYYLGIDAGSVSTKLVVLNAAGELTAHSYLPTQGAPVAAVHQGLKDITRRQAPTSLP
jgi:activator of 2-hydroxyglutaryl-CoA dehydratase